MIQWRYDMENAPDHELVRVGYWAGGQWHEARVYADRCPNPTAWASITPPERP